MVRSAGWLALVGLGCAKAPAPTPPIEAPGVRGLEVLAPSEIELDSAALYERRVALVVGISDYADPALDLGFARADAEAVGQLLNERFGFEVRALYDENADQRNVLAALSELGTLGPDDALLVYWGGHGTTETLPGGDQIGYLVPHDGALDGEDVLTRGLSMDHLRSILGRRVPARHTFLVVDACYSGLLTTRGLHLPPRTVAYLQAATSERAYQVLTAGRADQQVLDGGAHGHSVFADRLLQRLRAVDDYVTAEELSVDIRRKVQADANRRNHAQTPDYGRIEGDGDFVFVPDGATLESGLPVADVPEPAALRPVAPRLGEIVQQLSVRLLLLQGEKQNTLQRLIELRDDPNPTNQERAVAQAGRQLDVILDLQSTWEAALEELVVEDFELTRQIAWDVQRITDVLRDVTERADARPSDERLAGWISDLEALQRALGEHVDALRAL